MREDHQPQRTLLLKFVAISLLSINFHPKLCVHGIPVTSIIPGSPKELIHGLAGMASSAGEDFETGGRFLDNGHGTFALYYKRLSQFKF